jgi:ABC-type lipoprotein release transport system permease subunit
MSEAVVIALIGFLGTLAGSAIGVIASAKLTNYRLEQLENKVNLHNNAVERLYNLERNHAVLEQRVEDFHSEG